MTDFWQALARELFTAVLVAPFLAWAWFWLYYFPFVLMRDGDD